MQHDPVPLMLYVVTRPPRVRGIYETWAACEVVVCNNQWVRFQVARTRAEAEALLSGDGVILPPGLYAFVGGNHRGGVGVILVNQVEASTATVQELSTSVQEVFADGNLSCLGTTANVEEALARLRNVLAELAALYLTLRLTPTQAFRLTSSHDTLTVVHDDEYLEAWLSCERDAKDPVIQEIVEACHGLMSVKKISVRFRR